MNAVELGGKSETLALEEIPRRISVIRTLLDWIETEHTATKIAYFDKRGLTDLERAEALSEKESLVQHTQELVEISNQLSKLVTQVQSLAPNWREE